jgi:hypothetical protein
MCLNRPGTIFDDVPARLPRISREQPQPQRPESSPLIQNDKSEVIKCLSDINIWLKFSSTTR